MPSARQVKWAKSRVSVVSVAALAILGVLAYLLTGGTVFQEKTTVYLYIPDATGLGPGAPMRVNGIDVGRVASVTLSGSANPDRVVRVTIKAQRDRLDRIPVDSFAQLSADTMIGDMFVDVTSGKSPNHIQPNGEISFQAQVALLKSLDLTQFDRELKTVDAVLTDIEQGQSRVGQFVVGEQTYDDLRKRLAAVQQGIRDATDTTTAVGKALGTDELYRRIADPLVELDRSLARLQSARTGLGSYLHDQAQYDQMRKAAGDVRSSIASLRASDLMKSESMYTAWNARLQSLIRSVDEANAAPPMLNSAWYEQMDGAVREMRDVMKDFHESPQKFLRMQIF